MNMESYMQLYKLNKTVLSIQNNPVPFLNGLTSNSPDKPQNSFLNIHGRIVATFDQIKITDNEFWVVLERLFIDSLLSHLDRHIKLSKVEVKRLDKHVYFDLDSSFSHVFAGILTVPQKRGRMIISDQELQTAVSDEVFTLFRLKNNIPIQGIDYRDEFILNIGGDSFVSFTKGCFLGQEPVSKVHNRSRPSRQLVVKYENDCDEELKKKMTSKILDPDTNRVLGFVFIQNT